jgi:hypothetical protein
MHGVRVTLMPFGGSVFTEEVGMKQRLRLVAVPFLSFALAALLSMAAGPVRLASGRQAAQCTGPITCTGTFTNDPVANLTVTNFDFHVTPIAFTSTLTGTETSVANAQGTATLNVVYTYTYPNGTTNTQTVSQTLPCKNVSRQIKCGTHKYIFPKISCQNQALAAAAAAVAPPSNPAGGSLTSVTFPGCQTVTATVTGDCNGTAFANQLSISLGVNRNGTWNSNNPNPAKPCP